MQEDALSWSPWVSQPWRNYTPFLPAFPDLAGYLFVCRCPGPRPEDPVTIVHHLRLFRRHKAIRFEGRIHEQVLPSIRRAGLEIALAPVEVVHSGYDWSPEGQQKKQERDLRILDLALKERPEHPFENYNMGMTMNALGRWPEAIGYLHQSIQRSRRSESQLRKAYAVLVNSYHHQHGPEAALQVALDGLQIFPEDPELLFRAGELFRLQGEPATARGLYERLLEHREPEHCTSVDLGILSYRTRHSLALALRDLHELEKSELQLRRCLDENPRFLPACSLLLTARKLKVNFYDYVRDRISGAYSMPSLAELIRQRSDPRTTSLHHAPALAAA